MKDENFEKAIEIKEKLKQLNKVKTDLVNQTDIKVDLVDNINPDWPEFYNTDVIIALDMESIFSELKEILIEKLEAKIQYYQTVFDNL